MSVTDLWQTPPELWGPLMSEFHFTLDVAADGTNRKVRRYLGPGGIVEDALSLDWDREVCWMNPPYSETTKWVARAAANAELHCSTVVGLLPYMPSEGWWKYVEQAVEVRRIPHRVRFLKPDGTQTGGARFASAVVVWRPQPGIKQPCAPRYVTWSWR